MAVTGKCQQGIITDTLWNQMMRRDGGQCDDDLEDAEWYARIFKWYDDDTIE